MWHTALAWFLLIGAAGAAAFDQDCRSTPVDGPERVLLAAHPGSSRAGPVRFTLSNAGARRLFVELDPASQAPRFELRAGVALAALAVAQQQFCPTLCPAQGPAQEVDCRAPIPAVRVLNPGSSAELVWSGEVSVEETRECAGRPPRTCSKRLAAPAGRYRVRICAFPDIDGTAVVDPDAATLMRVRVRGVPGCSDVDFDTPAAGAVEVRLNTGPR